VCVPDVFIVMLLRLANTMNLLDQDVKESFRTGRGSTDDFRSQEIPLVITSSEAFTLAQVAWMRMEIILQRAQKRRDSELQSWGWSLGSTDPLAGRCRACHPISDITNLPHQISNGFLTLKRQL